MSIDLAYIFDDSIARYTRDGYCGENVRLVGCFSFELAAAFNPLKNYVTSLSSSCFLPFPEIDKNNDVYGI